MPAGHHPHGTTAYAPPVTCRAPSPASSIGTLYDDDATSDHELNMTPLEFERFCEEKIKISQPRPEEERAERDVLVTDKARGAGGEAEQALFERIMNNLRGEIKRLEDEEIYERALMKGSQIGLEHQAPTSDIDKIMRSMMGPGFKVSDTNDTQTTSTQPAIPKPAVTNGPWNNHGKKPASLKPSIFAGMGGMPQMTSASPRSSTSAAPTTSFASNTTAGTNGTGTGHGLEEPMFIDEHDLSLGSNTSFAQGWPASSSTPLHHAGSSDGTVVGGKRTRNGLARR
ncbi:hypothetical protein D9611_009487 [Ephemerocybe angulata]|uniref:Uncharacterized protein n=1 Tax=Ephemerocybe angulata TaxID=980116 RepID=A0A8H5AW09_9AGAR|nr:hypothetical protein D9611_009487 [Tulosesus angulatus]